MVGRDLTEISSFGIFVRGNQYMFYMHFEIVKFLRRIARFMVNGIASQWIGMMGYTLGFFGSFW